MNSRTFYYYMPLTTLIGIDAVKKVGVELKKRNVKRSLLVTDGFVAKFPVLNTLKEILDCSGINTAVYSDVKPNSTIAQVCSAAALRC